MNKCNIPSQIIFVIIVIISMVQCNNKEQKQEETVVDNVLLKKWTGPYGGVPHFDKMKVEDIKPAMIKGIELHLKEIDAISNSKEKPTFENTIEEMERAGKELDRGYAYLRILRNNMSTPAFRTIQLELSPIFSDYSSKISQNKKLFQRIKTIYDASLKKPLDKDKQRVIDLIYMRFKKRGAELDDATKLKYAALDKKLSLLYTKFSNNVLHDEEGYVTYLNKNELDGLPDDFTSSAAIIAKEKGFEGKYAVTNTRSSMDPFLRYSSIRSLRKKVWENYYSRGDNGDKYDNNKIIAEILQLRLERVKLLGYKNFAEWKLIDKMAKKPENAMNLLMEVWPKAIARVKEEVKDMQKIADDNGDKITIKPWDYRYYAEKVRKKKYDLDSEEVKQYLQLDKLTEALHYVAKRLFHFDFKPVKPGVVPVFHKDVKVWEVSNSETGENVGLWYLDPFARDGKSSGAWASSFRSQSSFDGEKNVLSTNNSNFIKPADGQPTLISWDDAETFFHEFGHALHYLSSNVKYPTENSGIVDYTEFQSQLLERWLYTEEVINNYLVHNKTGKAIPKELVDKIKIASTFNQGFATTEYLASAIMDMKLHFTDPTNIDIDVFEKKTLKALNMPKELPMRHRTPQFSHVFSSEGYAASYYGYLWAEVLTSDAAEMFANAPGGFYDEDAAKKLVKYLFSPRNSIDPNEAYRLFRGRDATIDALLRDRGFMAKE